MNMEAGWGWYIAGGGGKHFGKVNFDNLPKKGFHTFYHKHHYSAKGNVLRFAPNLYTSRGMRLKVKEWTQNTGTVNIWELEIC